MSTAAATPHWRDAYRLSKEDAQHMYIQVLHRMIVGMLVVILGLAVILVSQGNHVKLLKVEIAQLNTEKAAVVAENTDLKGMLVPILKKVDEATRYLQAEHGLPYDKAHLYATNFMKTSLESGMPFLVTMATAWRESHFDANALSYNYSSHGMMQVNWYWWKDYFGLKSKKELYDPVKNIAMGTEILRWNYENHGRTLYSALYHYYGTDNPAANDEYASDVLLRSRILRRKFEKYA